MILITLFVSNTWSMDREKAVALLCDSSWWSRASTENLEELLIHLEEDAIKYSFCGEDSNSFLHLAAMSTPYTEVIKHLLNLGSLIWIRNRLGQTVVDVASINNNPEVSKILQDFLQQQNDLYNNGKYKWYVGLGVGFDVSSNLHYKRVNQDTTCYPNAACFNNGIPSPVSGYLWTYNMNREPGASLDFFTGIGIKGEKLRVEVSFVTQESSLYQEANELKYSDGVMYSFNPDVNPQTTVLSDAMLNISNIRTNTLVGNIYSETRNVFSQETIHYIGIGMGVVFFDVDEIEFSTEYQDIENPLRDLSSYNSYTKQGTFHIVPTLQLHTGLDFNTDDKVIFGIKFTASIVGSIGYDGIYLTHPMQNIDPNFSFSEGFDEIASWRTAFVIKWRKP